MLHVYYFPAAISQSNRHTGEKQDTNTQDAEKNDPQHQRGLLTSSSPLGGIIVAPQRPGRCSLDGKQVGGHQHLEPCSQLKLDYPLMSKKKQLKTN